MSSGVAGEPASEHAAQAAGSAAALPAEDLITPCAGQPGCAARAAEARPAEDEKREAAAVAAVAAASASKPRKRRPAARRRLEFGMDSLVPDDLTTSDVEFSKLWNILAARGWRFVNGDLIYANFYLAPNVNKHEGRLYHERFPSAESLMEFVVRHRNTLFFNELEEYFTRHPPFFEPVDLDVSQVTWSSMWTILRRFGWKTIAGGLTCSYLYYDEKVDAKTAFNHIGTHAFKSSRDATIHILNNQAKYSRVITEYLKKHPISAVDTMGTEPHEVTSASRGSRPVGEVCNDDEDSVVCGLETAGEEATKFAKEVYDDIFGDDEHANDGMRSLEANGLQHQEQQHLDRHRADPSAAAGHADTANSANVVARSPSPSHKRSLPQAVPPTEMKRPRRVDRPVAQSEIAGVDHSKLFNYIWAILKKKHGWTHTNGNLLYSFAFLKPGLRTKSEGIEGKDYFIGEAALVSYACMEHSQLVREFLRDNETPHAPPLPSRQNLVQIHEPQVRRAADERNHSRLGGAAAQVSAMPQPKKLVRDVPLTFAQVFSRMRKLGWTYKRSSHPLKTFCYLAPGVRSVREGVLNVTMFEDEEAMMDYYHKNLHTKFASRFDQSDEVDESDDAGDEEHDDGDDEEEEEDDEEEGEAGDDENGEDEDTRGGDLNSSRSTTASGSSHQMHFTTHNKSKKSKLLKAARRPFSTQHHLKATHIPPHAHHPRDTPPSLGPDGGPRGKDKTFNDIWPELQQLGWKHFRGSGLVSYYYAKPHVQTKSEGKLGIDMFDSEEAVVEQFYKHNQGREVAASGSEYDSSSPSRSTQSHSETSSSSEESDAGIVDDARLGDYVWTVLRDEFGWTYKSGNHLHAFCYLKPPLTKKSDGVEGHNLFTGYGALLKYVRRRHPDIIEAYEQLLLGDDDEEEEEDEDEEVDENEEQDERRAAATQQRGIARTQGRSSTPHQRSRSPQRRSKASAASGSFGSRNSGGGSSRSGAGPRAARSDSTDHDQGLIQFVRAALQKQHGWELALVKRTPSGSVGETIVGEHDLVTYVCTHHSSLVVQYASGQKKSRR